MKKFSYAVLGFAGTMVGSTIFLNSPLMAKSEEEPKTRLEALAKFTKVLSAVEKYYVDDITLNEVIEKSIEGLLNNLDAHSSYMDEKKYKDLKVHTEGEFGGLGITVGMRDGALTVIAPIEGTPADKAGIKAGDIILKIGNKSTLNMQIDEAVEIMRGKPKTNIELTIVRKGETKPLTIKITRDIIKIESVYSKMIENENIVYIRITNFDKNVVEETQKALSKYVNAKGVIVDLRNNPGGLLNQAVGLVDLFVEDGVIVSQKGKVESENTEYKATKIGTFANIPVVVLVNGGSASASEIVSGAIQDLKRGIVIGEKTFGKGSVQVVLPIDEKEAIRLTVARYYLPSGKTIQAEGLVPDIIVHPGKVPAEDNGFAIKEKELKKHLESELDKMDDEDVKNGNGGVKSKDAKKEEKDKDRSKDKDKKDIQNGGTSTKDGEDLEKNQVDKRKKEVISHEDLLEDIQLKTSVDIIKVLEITKNK